MGRVAAAPEHRELPSGDRLVVWRLVVDRPAERRHTAGRGRQPGVDTLDCAAWTTTARRCAAELVAGDVAQITGALRRRFWRTGAGAASRCEVEVEAVTRLLSAPAGPRRTAPGAGAGADADAVCDDGGDAVAHAGTHSSSPSERGAAGSCSGPAAGSAC